MEADNVLEAVIDKLGERYEFIKTLGTGRFSNVYLVKDRVFGNELALKVMDFDFILKSLRKTKSNDTAIKQAFQKINKRFINEAKIIKRIKHSNIVKIFDINKFIEDRKKIEVPYLTMQYIKGPSLEDIINREGPISLESALKISEDVLSALRTIHENNIVHRDIKPANIMKNEQTNDFILIDFSIAKDIVSGTKITELGIKIGTQEYMAPEQIDYKSKIAPATDIYSFGVVLFEMLTKDLPFKGSSEEIFQKHLSEPVPGIREWNSELPKGIEDVIKKAMAKKSSDRFENAEMFKNSLKKIVQSRIDESRDLNEVLRDIGDTYEVIDCLDKGGFSKVYLVRKRELDSYRVLKVLKYSYLSENGKKDISDFKERFSSQGKSLTKINHENIVKIYDIGHAGMDEIPYLIMEYVKGKSLDELIKGNAPINYKEALKIAENILSALSKMHKCEPPIVHRDIKPASIMIEEESGKAKLIDFGIAKNINDTSCITDSHTVTGTCFYMSPEQWNGGEDIYPTSDIYSFGVILYELLAGEVPFRGKNQAEIRSFHLKTPPPNIREVRPDLTKGIENVIQKAMAKNPNERYQNAGEFKKALNKLKKKRKNIKTAIEIFGIALTIVSIILTLITIFPPSKQNGKLDSQHKKNIDSVKIEDEDFSNTTGRSDKARKINDTPEIKDLSRQTQKKQVDSMKADFENLKQFLEGDATKKEKLQECQDFLEKHENTHDNEKMVDKTKQFISQLNAEIRADEQLEAERKNGTKEYNAIKDNLDLSKYLAFKRKYPNSDHLRVLRFGIMIKDGNLPPEKYWNRPIKKNKKGYYELTFGKEHNGHIMIYIPEKKIWIDKYEVSNSQFKRFSKAPDDELPAITTYEMTIEYCKRFSFRLPNEDEWKYAAGKGRYKYPWGDENADVSGIYRANFDSLEGTVEKDGFEFTAPVKSFEKFSSPFGVVNMAGNVWEWVRGNILKGGGYLSSKEALKINNSKPGNNDEEGFRCVKDEK